MRFLWKSIYNFCNILNWDLCRRRLYDFAFRWFHVLFQMYRSLVRLPASAGMRPRAGMNRMLVLFKMSGFEKRFIAFMTRMRPIRCVDTHVTRQAAFLLKRHRTSAACVRLNFCVKTFVFPQSCGMTESHVASIASKRSLPSMTPQVGYKLGALSERFAARFTRKRLSPCVCLCVRF